MHPHPAAPGRLALTVVLALVHLASCDCSDGGIVGNPSDTATADSLDDPTEDVAEDGVLDTLVDTEPEPAPYCGDGVSNDDEQCDGDDVAGLTCEAMDLGFTGGVLRCSFSCELDTSWCSTCGNSIIEMHEDCEGDDLDGESCSSLGLSGTGLTCTPDCLFDTSTCSVCGDGVIEGEEQCDDANLVLWDGCNDCQIAEFVVNEWLGSRQEDPCVALSNTGDMVAAWFDNSERFGSSTRYVMARTYFADGTPPGPEWQASILAGDEPEVEIDDSDRVIMIWHSPNTSMVVRDQCNYYGLFDIDGIATGDEFPICLGYDGIDHQATDLAAAADGSFIAAWTRSYESGFGHQYDAIAQRFDPEGERIGTIEELAVLGHGTRRTSVASAADARSVMVWFTTTQEAIHGNLYDADGTLVSWLFQVTTEPLFVLEGALAVDMDDSGEFIVVWSNGSSDSYEDRDIHGRSYYADGSPKAPAFVISPVEGYRQEGVDVRIFPDGRRLVVWESLYQDGDGFGIYGRILDADDSFIGPEFPINTITTGNQQDPDIDMDPTGRFAIVWEEEDDVFAQRFDADGTPVGVLPW